MRDFWTTCSRPKVGFYPHESDMNRHPYFLKVCTTVGASDLGIFLLLTVWTQKKNHKTSLSGGISTRKSNFSITKKKKLYRVYKPKRHLFRYSSLAIFLLTYNVARYFKRKLHLFTINHILKIIL